MKKDLTNLYKSYEWVKRAILSCTTVGQLRSCTNLIDLFYNKFKDRQLYYELVSIKIGCRRKVFYRLK